MRLATICVVFAVFLVAVQSSASEKSTELSTKVRNKRFLEDVQDFVGGVGGVLGEVAGIVTGPIGQLIGGLFGGGGDDGAEERHREQMALMRQQHCYENCVGDWSPWTACTRFCGGGTTTRSRQETIPGDCGEGFSCGKVLQQTATCNPGCPHGGSPKSGGGCTCPAGRTGPCCQTEVKCKYPGRPDGGDIDGIFPAVFGTVVTYSCNEGYSLSGDSEIECLQTGKWSGRKPNCASLQCAMPSPPANGDIINKAASYYFSQEIMYRCNDGYVRVGPETRKCSKLNEQAAWSGFSPLCVETSCGDPGYPLNGEVDGGDFSLGGKVQISCAAGYRLIGSTERTCLPSGTWSGHDTECKPISCEPPVAPRYGRILPAREAYVFGRYVTVRCDPGYQLKGKQKLKCIKSTETIVIGGGGMWDSEPPTCEAVSCGDPGVPQQGAKDGSMFIYPHNVTFSCFAGYTLSGSSKIHCDSTGSWSASTPECIACPKNTYKANTNLDSPCQPCPPNTHTVTAASNNKDQCICNHGFKADSQGVCQEIQCPPLQAPPQGSIASCQNKLGSVCQVTCNDGYVLSIGVGKRQCLEDGSWSGTDAACQACPINTYKGNERICVPCPRHSHTDNIAQSEDGCICDDGYTAAGGEGECVDFDECVANGGKGPCSDICVNKEGGYDCDCSIPGYIINPLDKHVCILEKTCRNLTTQNDAPSNGGLVCHWYYEENSQQCAMRCDPGFEFPARVNNYEYCGPSTGYLWSHEERGELIEDCIEEMFPDFRLEADSFYFSRACALLTPAEQLEVKQQFADMLTEQGVCVKRQTKVCDVKNIGIICGESKKRRRRRSVNGVDVEEEEEVDEVMIQMDVKAHRFQESIMDCDQICTMLRIPPARCSALCVKTYKRFLRAAVLYSKKQLEALYRNPSAVTFAAANRDFEARGVATKDVVTECEVGMRAEGELCVPCSKGTFHEPRSNTCKHCSPGFYQPLEKQLTCLPCPVGTTSDKTKATSCHVCTNGTYGVQCRETCGPCVNGNCHPVTGKCECESGWEGDACDVDTQGCTATTCYPGVKCWDILAPGTGFVCGKCPEGTRGDGIFCEIIPFGHSEL